MGKDMPAEDAQAIVEALKNDTLKVDGSLFCSVLYWCKYWFPNRHNFTITEV